MEKSLEGRNELTGLIFQTYAVQKAFGDKSRELEARDAIFQELLKTYTYKQIYSAFLQYIRLNPDIPAPSDIIKIIEPPKPELCGAYYLALKNRLSEGDYLLESERNYIMAYEQNEKSKLSHYQS